MFADLARTWPTLLGIGSIGLAYVTFLFVFSADGTSILKGELPTIKGGYIFLGGLVVLALASYLLRSKTLWWRVLLSALATAAGVVAVLLFITAFFSFQLGLLVPAAKSFVILLISGTALTYLQKRFVR